MVTLNSFCQTYDLIYVEECIADGCKAHRFLDFRNTYRIYTEADIEGFLTQTPVSQG